MVFTKWRLYLADVLVLICFASQVFANPTGGVVVRGNATIVSDGSRMVVTQAGQKVVIDWNGFSIAQGESTQFAQPGSTAIALNRVSGAEMSRIDGALLANGQVWLANPNGIVVGSTGTIDAAGLLATTAWIDADSFMAGDYQFRERDTDYRSVVNNGTIRVIDGGYVALVGAGVANTGVIRARLGTVALASGTAYTMDFGTDGLVRYEVGSEVDGAVFGADGTVIDASVDQSGAIYANGGAVYVTATVAQDVLAQVVNMDGVIEANHVTERNGRVVLNGGAHGITEVSGQIYASKGHVEVRGDKVGVVGNAVIDTSGHGGGGTILVGGDYKGQGPGNDAEVTYVGSEAFLTADAIEYGDGGRVIVWADHTTRSYGHISVRGGMLGGDGGFVETSGYVHLDVRRAPDISAVSGSGGTWLLDPRNFTITNSDDGYTQDPARTYTSTADDAVIGVTTIQDALNNGSVIVQTGSSGSQAGDLTVSSTIQWNNANSLVLKAHRDLIVDDNVDIENSGSGGITLESDVSGGGTGVIDLGDGVAISTVGGAISFDGDVELSGDASVSTGAGGGNISFLGTVDGGSDLTLTAGTGTLTASGVIGGTTRLSALQVVSAGSAAFNENVSVTSFQQQGGSANFAKSLSTTGTVGLTNLGIDFTGSSLTFRGPVTATNGGGLEATVSFILTTESGGDISLDGSFTQNGSGENSIAGDITTTNDAITFNGKVTLGDGVRFDSGVGAGTISFMGELWGATNRDQDLTLAAGTGNIDFDDAVGRTPLRDMVIETAADVTADDLFVVKSFHQKAGTGTTTFAEKVHTSGPVATVDLSPLSVVFVGTNLAVNDGVSATNAGAMRVTNSGTFTTGGEISLDGAFTQNGTGPVSLGGNVTTTGDDINFLRAVTLTGDVVMTTGTGSGTITFQNTVNSSAGSQYDLSLTAGTGNIDFDAAVGGVNSLGAFLVTSAQNVTIDSALTATTVTQQDGTGTTTFSGNVTTTGTGDNGNGIELKNNAFAGAGNLDTTNNYPVSLTFDTYSHTGQIDAGTETIEVHTKSAGRTIGLEDASQNINFLNGTLANWTAGTVQFGDTSHTGGITIGTDRAVNANKSLTFISGGPIRVNNPITTTNGGGVTFTNNSTLTLVSNADLSLDGVFLQNGSGSVTTGADITTTGDDITFSTPTVLSNDVAFSTGDGVGKIVFQNTLDGTTDYQESLTLTGGQQDVDFNGAVGSITPLGDVDVVSADDITAKGTFSVNSFFRRSGGSRSKSTFEGLVTINQARPGSLVGFEINGNDVEIKDGLTVSNGANVVLNTTGGFTLSSGSNLNLDGSFTQTGPGGSSNGSLLSGNISTTGDSIHFQSAVIVVDDITISTGAGAGDITFDRTLASLTGSPRSLVLNAGTGDVTFGGVVGSVQFFGSNNEIETSRLGSLTITTSGDFRVNNGSDLFLDGAFDRRGQGRSYLSGDISTTGDNISFAGPVTLSNDLALSTGDGGGNILFSSTLDGTVDYREDLDLTIGTGSLSFIGFVGRTVPLGNMRIIGSGSTFSLFSIDALSVSPRIQSLSDAIVAAVSQVFDRSGLSGNELRNFDQLDEVVPVVTDVIWDNPYVQSEGVVPGAELAVAQIFPTSGPQFEAFVPESVSTDGASLRPDEVQ